MFLLKLFQKGYSCLQGTALHSTMFLLKPCLVPLSLTDWFSFTFHNVSIKTSDTSAIARRLKDFTFHNVSIKTKRKMKQEDIVASLHSTMFLLKRNIKEFKPLVHVFTFHNVSIKTETGIYSEYNKNSFTFHNVSIKTLRQLRLQFL